MLNPISSPKVGAAGGFSKKTAFHFFHVTDVLIMGKDLLYTQEKKRVIQTAQNQQIKRSFAEELIKKSAYWYSHPSGYPVHAPNHFKHIYDPVGRKYALLKALGDENIAKPIKNDWKIDFGSNTFLISNAILKCQSTLLNCYWFLHSFFVILPRLGEMF